ncbi:MAG TPA: aminotransferase class V-fold PLP-dependent enzyme [Paenibacillaceae bacterium]
MDRPVVYLDNAATSWPKPPGVLEAMTECLQKYGANPGRGSHGLALQAGRVLLEARQALARLFRVANPNDIIFTLNTTHALNIAIQGSLRPGDHAVTTAIEHNSIRRPLEAMRRLRGVDVTYVRTDEAGRLDPADLVAALRPNTRLVAVTHSSNLLGTLLPVGEIGAVTRSRGILFLVDAAQTAGTVDIDVEAMNIDLLAFPGHKGLMGPLGTGGLYIRPDVELEPLMYGGTGSRSEEPAQPEVRPDKYEAGSPNTVGIAGLGAGVRFVLERSVREIAAKERMLTRRLMDGLRDIPGVRILGPGPEEERTAIVSFVLEGIDPAETAFRLDREYGIAVRAGYHCAPLAHERAGTLDRGAVRASPGYFNSEADIDALVAAVEELAKRRP